MTDQALMSIFKESHPLNRSGSKPEPDWNWINQELSRNSAGKVSPSNYSGKSIKSNIQMVINQRSFMSVTEVGNQSFTLGCVLLQLKMEKLTI